MKVGNPSQTPQTITTKPGPTESTPKPGTDGTIQPPAPQAPATVLSDGAVVSNQSSTLSPFQAKFKGPQ